MSVIVACPKCHKQYRLDVSRLVYNKLPDGSGMGVQLACSNCYEQWWEVKKDEKNTNQNENKALPEKPFRNLTDISLLYNNQGMNYTYQQPLSANIRSFGVEENERLLPNNQKKLNDSGLKKVKWLQVTKVILTSFLLFTSIIAVAVFAMGYKLPKWHGLFVKQNTVNSGKVLIENIRFKIKPIDENHQRVIVGGIIKNSTPLSIPLKNIDIIALGSCTAGNVPNADGLCKVRVWQYKWKKDTLMPGEQIPFKSVAKVPANTSISQISISMVP